MYLNICQQKEKRGEKRDRERCKYEIEMPRVFFKRSNSKEKYLLHFISILLLLLYKLL